MPRKKIDRKEYSGIVSAKSKELVRKRKMKFLSVILAKGLAGYGIVVCESVKRLMAD